MRNAMNPAVVELRRAAAQFQPLFETQSWSVLVDRAWSLRARCEKSGVQSTYVLWCEAVALSQLGRLEEALAAVSRAAVLDPFDPRVQQSFADVCGALREKLCAEEADLATDRVPRVYRLLADIGETDVECHLTLARYHLVHGAVPEAAALLDALRLLAPTRRAVWELRGECARRRGEPEVVQACEDALRGLQEVFIPYGIPGAGAPC
jgi:tetratricopeptide (TPR) repeat protein